MLTDEKTRDKFFRFEDSALYGFDTNYKLTLTLQMCPNGDKDISIVLADFRLMVHTGPLMEALAVLAMDDPELGAQAPQQEKQQL
jgi:hypothetical protein